MMVSHLRVGRVESGDGSRNGDWSRGVVGTKSGKVGDGFRDFFRFGELLDDSLGVIEIVIRSVMRPVLGVIPAMSAEITQGMVERGDWTDSSTDLRRDDASVDDFGGRWH